MGVTRFWLTIKTDEIFLTVFSFKIRQIISFTNTSYYILCGLLEIEFFGDVGILLVELLLPTITLLLLEQEFEFDFFCDGTDPFRIPLNLEESDERGESSEI